MSKRHFIPDTFHCTFIRTAIAAAVLVFVFPQPSLMLAQDAAAGGRRLVTKIEPTYPTLALKNGLQGTVKIRVVIGTDGHAKATEVLGGNPVLVGPAAESVKKWRWSAADHDTTEIVEVAFTSKS